MTDALSFKRIFREPLRRRDKTVTVRLGDRSADFAKGQVVTILLDGDEQAERLGDAVIEDVAVCPINSIEPEDLQREGVGLETLDDLVRLMTSIYARPLTRETTVTLVRFRMLTNV